MNKKVNMLTLALSIALLSPLWAVLSPYIGITTGSVALICAGVYVANGNKLADASKITIGFLCGDVWAILALFIMETLPFSKNIVLFITLFVLGGLAVIIGEIGHKFIYTPSWLCGWAIGLTIMGSMSFSKLHSLPLQIAVSMIVGVFYVGVGVDLFQKALIRIIKK